jgi:hypothetical protein
MGLEMGLEVCFCVWYDIDLAFGDNLLRRASSIIYDGLGA